MDTYEQAEVSVKTYGGVVSDYLKIHEFMDSSNDAIGDVRHMALTHNTWFIGTVLPRVFGSYITNSENNKIPVRDIGKTHIDQDFFGRFIPTASDFLAEMPIRDWMNSELVTGDVTYPFSSHLLKDQYEPTVEDLKRSLAQVENMAEAIEAASVSSATDFFKQLTQDKDKS